MAARAPPTSSRSGAGERSRCGEPGVCSSDLADQPALAQHGHDALAERVGLLDVGVAGEDELADPELVVLGHQVGDLLVAADHGGTGAGAQQTDAGPQVGIDLEAVAAAAV